MSHGFHQFEVSAGCWHSGMRLFFGTLQWFAQECHTAGVPSQPLMHQYWTVATVDQAFALKTPKSVSQRLLQRPITGPEVAFHASRKAVLSLPWRYHDFE